MACSSPPVAVADSVEESVRQLLAHAKSFINNHRYDPVEVYGEEYREFCVDVPDPKKQPITIFDNFESVLNELGKLRIFLTDNSTLQMSSPVVLSTYYI